jgi:hypothetical protein
MKIGLRRASSGDAENICAVSIWFSGACRPLQVVPDPASARPRPLQPYAVNSRPDGQIPVVSFPSLHARHLTVSVQDQWRSRLLMCPFISYLELPFARLSVVTWSQRGQCYPHVERDVWGNTFVGSSFLLWEYVVLLSSGTGHGAVSSGPNKTLHCR